MAAKPPVWPVVNGLPVSRVVTQAQVDVVKEMQFYPEDLWIASYPKAGTTWTQQIVKLIHTRGEDNGKKVDQSVPWIEAMNNPDPAFDYRVDLSILKHPRAFKSHFTYELMPCGEPSSSHCKFIYVARNPKDTAVSYFYHYQGFKYVPVGLKWEDFISWFIAGDMAYGDYFDHVLSWWTRKDEENILFLKFEDMKRDLCGSIREISCFMNIELDSEVVEKIAEKASFSNMKQDPRANLTWLEHRWDAGVSQFMRKGQVGDWKGYFTSEQSRAVDELYESRFKSVGLEFDFEL